MHPLASTLPIPECLTTRLYVGEKTGRFWHIKNQHLLQRIDPSPSPLLLIAYSKSSKYPAKFLMLLIDLCCLKNRSRGCDFGVGEGANIGQFSLRCRAPPRPAVGTSEPIKPRCEASCSNNKSGFRALKATCLHGTDRVVGLHSPSVGSKI